MTSTIWVAALALIAASEHPSFEVETGAGIVCDTRAQIEEIADLGPNQQSVKTVNADAGTNVCVMAEVAFIKGAKYQTLHVADKTFQVTEILVTGFKTPDGWHQLKPMIQWTLFPIEEMGA